MARTPAAALKWAEGVTKGYSNLCLQYVRLAYDVPAKYPSAISAWNNAKKRHGSLSNAPDGAPVFLSHPKSKYGHVALLKRIGGVLHLRTTNSAVGRPVTQTLDLWTKQYGYTLLGWTEDLNGVDVAKPVGGGTATPPPAQGGGVPSGKIGRNYLKRGDVHEKVRELQQVLNRWYPGLPRLAEDGSFGPATEARVIYLQGKAGLKKDGLAGPRTLGTLGITGVA